MMGFNHVRATFTGRCRLNDIGINRPLREPLDAPDFLRFFFKNFYKQTSDHLALVFRIRNPGKCRQKALFRLHRNQTNTHVFRKQVLDFFRFIQTQQSGIHKHAGQLLLYGLMEQCRDD